MGIPQFRHIVTSAEELARVIGVPSGLVLKKQLRELDAHMERFIAESLFLLLGTVGRDGSCDAGGSPWGELPRPWRAAVISPARSGGTPAAGAQVGRSPGVPRIGPDRPLPPRRGQRSGRRPIRLRRRRPPAGAGDSGAQRGARPATAQRTAPAGTPRIRGDRAERGARGGTQAGRRAVDGAERAAIDS